MLQRGISATPRMNGKKEKKTRDHVVAQGWRRVPKEKKRIREACYNRGSPLVLVSVSSICSLVSPSSLFVPLALPLQLPAVSSMSDARNNLQLEPRLTLPKIK